MGFAMRTRDVGTAGPPVAIGIDLGTAFCRVGVWKDADVLIIPNDQGRLATPSCVAFTEHSVLVGEAALLQSEANLENTIFAPQRLLGSRFENPVVQWYRRSWPTSVVRGDDDRPMLRVMHRGKERLVRPEEVVTLLLEHLRKSAEKHLGVPAIEAVVTVPAQFGQAQSEALLEACRGARLKVLALVKAPSAAGIAFCLTNPMAGRRNVLVCDLGASYFDFSLLSVDGGEMSERAVGTDFVDLDSSLLRFCRQDLKDRYLVNLSGPEARDQLARLRLRNGCEEAKRKLSQFNDARIVVDGIIDGVDYAVAVSRGHFEDLCRLDLEPLLEPIDFCLRDYGLERTEVDVILVGGCARVPMVRRAVREFFYGCAPREVLRPDHAAVLGAAVYVTALSCARTPPNSPSRGGGADNVSESTSAPEQDSSNGAVSGGVPNDIRRLRLDQVDPGFTAFSESGIATGLPAARFLDASPEPAAKPAAGLALPSPGPSLGASIVDYNLDPPSPPSSRASDAEAFDDEGGLDFDVDTDEAAPRDEALGRTVPPPTATRGRRSRGASGGRMA